MEQLVESIRRSGVKTSATIRLKEDGRYELISGHQSKKICDENSFAETKNLPYGVYTVYQTSDWNGRELMRDLYKVKAALVKS